MTESQNAQPQLTRVLRISGALLLTVSASTMLITTWPEQSDIFRYLVLAAHVVMLFVGALYCGKMLREPKTARVLLWTASAIVPTLLAALGGLIYSQFSFEPAGTELPQVATWVAPNKPVALLLVGLSLPVIYGVTRATARVLSPGIASAWTIGYLAQCLLFLVPTRTPLLACMLSILGAGVALALELRVFHNTEASRTLEGRLLRGLLWLAPSMIAARTCIFYAPDAVFFGLFMLSGAYLVLLLVRRQAHSDGARSLVEYCCAAAAAFGAFILTFELSTQAWGEVFMLLPLLALASVARLALVSRQSLNYWAIGLGTGLSLVLWFEHGTLLSGLSFAAFFAGSAILNYLEHRPTALILNTLLALSASLLCVERLVGFADVHLWQVLSGLGLLSFVLATALEKRLSRLLSWFKSAPA